MFVWHTESPSLLAAKALLTSKTLLLLTPALLLTTKATLLVTPASLLLSVTALLTLNAVNAHEKHLHFLSVNSTVSVLIALLDSLPDLLLAVGRSHTHLQAEISVSVEEFLTLKLSGSVLIISLEDHFNLLLKSLVVVVVPSS